MIAEKQTVLYKKKNCEQQKRLSEILKIIVLNYKFITGCTIYKHPTSNCWLFYANGTHSNSKTSIIHPALTQLKYKFLA